MSKTLSYSYKLLIFFYFGINSIEQKHSNLKDYWTVWKPTQVNRDSSGVSREILVALKPFQPDLPKLLDSFSKQEYALTWKMLLAFTSIMYWWIFLKL